MKNECLKLIGNDDPLKSLRESQGIYVVSEVVDGRTVKTRLPKEKAQKLFRKIRTVNDTAWIRKEEIMDTISFKDTDEIFNIMAKDERYIIASRPYSITERDVEIKEWSDGLNNTLMEDYKDGEYEFDSFEEYWGCEAANEIEKSYKQDCGDCPLELDEDTFCYTIIDLKEKVRGGDNYYCRFNYSKVEECEKALIALNTITKMSKGTPCPEYELGISRRNKVELQLEEPYISAFEAEA